MSKNNISLSSSTPRSIFLSFVILSSLFLNVACQFLTPVSENNPEELLIEQQVSYQENTISLNSNELQQPLYLEITAPKNTKLVGKILLEDKAIANLRNNLTINLSSSLKSGKNTISITGNYEPESNSVSVKLQGKNTQSTTSTGGSGILQQKLIINVL